jgi:ribosomal protein S14
LLEAKGNQVKGKSFDNFGNYSFGINEHIDIPGVKYDPKIGILGLGISVTLTRPGYGIRTRSKHKASVGLSNQRVWSDRSIMAKDRSYEFTGRKKHEFGRGSRWCKRCGDYTAVIQKYDLMLCRRCFREVAVSLGFRKNQ